ncbi:MAG: hypothetical protein ACLURP_10200 [Ruminococcus sp.]
MEKWDKQSIFRRESLDRVENRTQFRKENKVMLKSRGGREENEKLLLSVKETCGLTGLSERIVRTLMAENDFTVRIGRENPLFIRKNLRNGWKNRRLEYFSGTC